MGRHGLRRAVSLALVGALLWPAAAAFAKPPASTSASSETLRLALPGPFSPCPVFVQDASSSTQALLDLIRPSAFLTNPNDFLVGAQGPISSAELVNLAPQTVVYTVAPHAVWSNGVAFTGTDLYAWWLRMRAFPGVASDGYRAIRTVSVSSDGLTVTARFAHPYADWATLFRDVEQRDAPLNCSWTSLLARPSLGPYVLVSASPTRWVLERDPRWQPNGRRFGRVVVTLANRIAYDGATPLVAYATRTSPQQIAALAAHPGAFGHLGPSNSVEELVFNGARPAVKLLAVRRALSWSVDRIGAINRSWSLVTQSVATATSSLYSQGQPDYPGGGVSPVSPPATTTTVAATLSPSAGVDCPACAQLALTTAGATLIGGRWQIPGVGPLIVRLAVGPTGVDHASARAIVAAWRALGASVSILPAASANQVAVDVASGVVDAGVFARPFHDTPTYAALSWTGPNYRDVYPSGQRTALWNHLYAQAMADLNPATAQDRWSQLDSAILASAFVRPLFTLPALTAWSARVVSVNTGDSVAALVDQLPSWSLSATAPS